MTTFWTREELDQDRRKPRRRFRVRELPGRIAGGVIAFLWIGVQRALALLQRIGR